MRGELGRGHDSHGEDDDSRGSDRLELEKLRGELIADESARVGIGRVFGVGLRLVLALRRVPVGGRALPRRHLAADGCGRRAVRRGFGDLEEDCARVQVADLEAGEVDVVDVGVRRAQVAVGDAAEA